MLDGLLAPGFADCFGVQTADFDYWEMGGALDVLLQLWLLCSSKA